MAEEKSSGFIAKLVGGVFTLVIAPVAVGVALHYLTPEKPPEPEKEPNTVARGPDNPGTPEPTSKSPAATPTLSVPSAVPSATPIRTTEPGDKKPPVVPPPTPPVQLTHFVSANLATHFTTYAKGGLKADHLFELTIPDGWLRVTGEGLGMLVTKEEYDNFQLTAEFRWNNPVAPKEKPHCGILLRATGPAGAVDGVWMKSVCCRLGEGVTGDLQMLGETSKGSLKAKGKEKAGEWNILECTCEADTIRVRLNNEEVNVATHINQPRGRLGIQCEAGEFTFRSLDLKPLKK
jgi:hypothetical protein